MTLASLKIRPLQSKELPLLHDFTPHDWNEDLALRFREHFGQPYFHPIAAELAGRVVGCANGLLNGTTGWLGNIVVQPDYRGQGIGTALTEHLVEYFHSCGCTSQVLTATRLGEPIYTKLGFTTRSTYAFLHKVTDITKPANQALSYGMEQYGGSFYTTGRSLARWLFHPRPIRQIRRAGPRDFEAMRALDEEITGEKRAAFLERHLAKGWVHQASPRQAVGGFFLPELDEGPIIARETQAGLALLRFKVRHGRSSFAIPSANQAAIDVMIGAGFNVRYTLPRMVLGPELNWHPEGVFGRAAGYCG